MNLGYTADLARSLIKLQIQNLSTMDADWMYASYHYSHPILAERLGALGWKGANARKAKESGKPKTADGVSTGAAVGDEDQLKQRPLKRVPDRQEL